MKRTDFLALAGLGGAAVLATAETIVPHHKRIMAATIHCVSVMGCGAKERVEFESWRHFIAVPHVCRCGNEAWVELHWR